MRFRKEEECACTTSDVCKRELPTGLVLNSFSFLSKFGYVVTFGSLFRVWKLNQDFKIFLVSSAIKKFNLWLPNCDLAQLHG